MKKLSELYNCSYDVFINDIKTNSKDIKKGDLFVCIKGVTKDRHEFVFEAINNGAVAIVAEKELDINIPLITVKNPNKELIKLSKIFYDFNEDTLLIATTGTNGKTTTSKIIQDLIGDTCGYIGTNGLISKNINEQITNTTPTPDRLYKYINMLKKDNCTCISMEASSEAFLRKRLDELKFKIGILTNITEDHLNVHKSLKNYISCKKKLFKNIRKDGFSILNIDDKYFDEFKSIAKGTILTYGKKESDLQILDIKEKINSTDIQFKYNNKCYKVKSPLVGMFNVYNLAAAMLSLLALNFKIEDILNNIVNIKVPKGRCETLYFNQNYYIILDYAHTPDAFTNIYSFLNKVKKKRIITVTGSAGGREKKKRKYMGKIVLDNSDLVIFTMDDPRFESVDRIIDDLVSLSKKNNYIRIMDRTTAINKALSLAKKDDIVLIAGKGRDNYMAIKDKYLPYNDYDVIYNYFNK